MANAIFTTSESSAYDDQPEARYHFPRTYLKQAEAAVGDWILYYEPRRTSGPHSATGRQAYFATAFVQDVVADPKSANHFYALVKDYLELDAPVNFRGEEGYRESMLRKPDGSTNKGAFGRSVRLIPRDEFEAIVRAGLTVSPEPWEVGSHVPEELAEYAPRPVIQRLQSRKFRDVAFRRHVRQAYDNRCAITGLRLINGKGRPEVQAAHIWAVENDGPDTVRNGLALTGTAHWLFDRGLISVSDDLKLLVSSSGLPDELNGILRCDQKLRLPPTMEHWPHPRYLHWHRTNRFKG